MCDINDIDIEAEIEKIKIHWSVEYFCKVYEGFISQNHLNILTEQLRNNPNSCVRLIDNKGDYHGGILLRDIDFIVLGFVNMEAKQEFYKHYIINKHVLYNLPMETFEREEHVMIKEALEKSNQKTKKDLVKGYQKKYYLKNKEKLLRKQRERNLFKKYAIKCNK